MTIESNLISNTIGAVYTCPAGQERAVTTLFFCNYSNDPVILQAVHLVPNAGSATDTNKIISNLTIPAGETFTFDAEKIILEAGDSIRASASNNSRLNITICTIRVL